MWASNYFRLVNFLMTCPSIVERVETGWRFMATNHIRYSQVPHRMQMQIPWVLYIDASRDAFEAVGLECGEAWREGINNSQLRLTKARSDLIVSPILVPNCMINVVIYRCCFQFCCDTILMRDTHFQFFIVAANSYRGLKQIRWRLKWDIWLEGFEYLKIFKVRTREILDPLFQILIDE